MLLLTQSDSAIGQRLADELAQVQAAFAAELTSDLDCVNSLLAHIERFRGKMLRPMLVLVSGLAAGRLSPAHRAIATVLEMVHMATLVHDDVLDEARVRRRSATINYLKGNEAAVMLGDYLISHAYHLCSGLGNSRVSRVIAAATNVVCEGELLQLANRGNTALDEDTYFQIIRRKTASLCGTCCELGASLNDAAPETAGALCRYGENLGMAFQIVDDLLDLVGTEHTVGKTLGRDLQKGKLTLPVIHCLATAEARQRRRLAGLLRRAPPAVAGPAGDGAVVTGEKLAAVIGIVTDNGSVEYANQQAGVWVSRAKEAVGTLADSPARALLLNMADTVLTRNF